MNLNDFKRILNNINQYQLDWNGHWKFFFELLVNMNLNDVQENHGDERYDESCQIRFRNVLEYFYEFLF